MRAFLIALVLSIAVGCSGLAAAADLGPAPPIGSGTVDAAAYRDALLRRAALYALRVHFDVLEATDVPALLLGDAKRLSSTGRIADEASVIDRDLIAEGSYYITSLRYLVAFGTANWPTDRTAAAYERDALTLLEALQGRWLDAVETGGDLLAILRGVDAINAWTEGSTTVTPALDSFAGIEAEVDEAIRTGGPVTGT